jgi:hypothetical protein
MAALPEAAPANGAAVVPVQPLPPDRPAGQWLVIGPRTRAQFAAQLERSMGVVLLALLETSGVPEGQEYTLVLDGAHLEPVAPKG